MTAKFEFKAELGDPKIGESNWQHLLVIIMKENIVYIPKRWEEEFSKIEVAIDETVLCSAHMLAYASGFVAVNHEVDRSVHVILENRIDLLLDLGLIEPCENDDVSNDFEKKYGVDVYHYRLSTKGVDVALKLVEHNDNEKRFQEQIDVSKTLKENSTNALRVSLAALLLVAITASFGFWRLNIADEALANSQKQLEISEKRLAILEQSLAEEKSKTSKGE